jgi:hypothetical protein
MSKDLPPPVTQKSSKDELWEELECARAEIDHQQRALNDWRDRLARAENEAGSLRYQIGVIRAVLAGDVQR